MAETTTTVGDTEVVIRETADGFEVEEKDSDFVQYVRDEFNWPTHERVEGGESSDRAYVKDDKNMLLTSGTMEPLSQDDRIIIVEVRYNERDEELRLKLRDAEA